MQKYARLLVVPMAAIALMSGLSACGQKGALYLPDEEKKVIQMEAEQQQLKQRLEDPVRDSDAET